MIVAIGVWQQLDHVFSLKSMMLIIFAYINWSKIIGIPLKKHMLDVLTFDYT